MNEETHAHEPIAAPSVRARLSAASVRCDNCGRITPHRVLRWDRGSFRTGASASGTARCRECHWTHRFEIPREEEVDVALITSRGAVTTRETFCLPASLEIEVGREVPGPRAPLRVHRIDLRAGGSVGRAPARSVASLWVSPLAPSFVPVSVLEGARTRTVRWSPGPEVDVEVGEAVEVEGLLLRIVALRVGGRTFRRAGDRFRAREVERLYGRRSVSPPAGRADWSQDRERPSSRASSFSRSARSRSAPGARTKRTVPRARIADGGATVQSVSPS